MKKVIFVAGPPGSGKTEFIKYRYLDKYKVFDLDTYREKNKKFSINNPVSYSENTAQSAGLMMNKDINNSLTNDFTIVIETTFSSYDNTLEQIKNKDDYQIRIYLFIVNEVEFFISTLERYMCCYIRGDDCRLIAFEKYLNKLKFYQKYIKLIKNYNINISYVFRNGKNMKIFDKYPLSIDQYSIECYIDRVNKIKRFCNQNKTPELAMELDKMLQYQKDIINKRVKKMKNEKSCGAIIELNGKILLVQQKKSGNYGFPKGHILPNESEIEAAIREVKEETNVDIEINSEKRYSLSYIQNENINKEVVYFLARPKKTFEIINQEKEVSRVFWVDKEKVRETLTYENLRQVWDQVFNDLH